MTVRKHCLRTFMVWKMEFGYATRIVNNMADSDWFPEFTCHIRAKRGKAYQVIL